MRTGVASTSRQPNAGIVRLLLNALEEKFDAFTTALSVLSGLVPEEEIPRWEAHMIVWAEYVGDLKISALETIQILDSALDTNQRVNNVTYRTLPQNNAVQEPGAQSGDNSRALDPQNGVAQGAPNTQGAPLNVQASTFQPAETNGIPDPHQEAGHRTEAETDAANGTRDVIVVQHGTNSLRVNVDGSDSGNQEGDTDLMLAILAMNTISAAIENDILSAEQEVAAETLNLNDAYLNELRDYCSEIERRVKGEFRDAGEKVARLDTTNSSNCTNALQGNSQNFLDRVRDIQREIRRARSSPSPSVISSRSLPQADGSSSPGQYQQLTDPRDPL